MSTRRGIRLLVAIAVGAIVLLELARWNGAAEARRARDVQLADSAAAAAVQRVAVRRRAAQASGRVYVGTVAPHVRAIAASKRQEDRTTLALETAETARAAAVELLGDSTATLQALRVELRRSADAIGALTIEVVALRDTARLERLAAARRIGAGETHVADLDTLSSAQAGLDSTRVEQVDTRERRRGPWWRRALGAGCIATTTGGGAALGSTGGPLVAAAGGIAGLAIGAIGCR